MIRSPSETAEFQRRLRETGSYRTDNARRRSVPDRLLGRFDFWFYWKLFRLVLAGNRLVAASRFDIDTWAAHSLGFVRILEDCGGRVDVSGVENTVGLEKPAVFVGNHMSTIESFMLPILLIHGARITAVIKRSLAEYPILGSFARATEPIRVGRKDPRQDLRTVLREGKASLAKGRSVVLFPQATRVNRFDPESFNTLGVKLAKSAGAPVIPLALKTDFLGVGRFIKDVGPLDRAQTIRFRFGRPMNVSGNGRDVNRRVAEFIVSCLDEWSGEVVDPGQRG